MDQYDLPTPQGSNSFFVRRSYVEIQPLRGWRIMGAPGSRRFHLRLLNLGPFGTPTAQRASLRKIFAWHEEDEN
jgi:hypothetical protein